MKKTVKRIIASLLVVIMVITAAPLGLVSFDDLFATEAVAADSAEVALPGYKTGDVIEFGSYPQSKVTDSSTISALNGISKNWVSYGYYTGTGNTSDGQMQPSDYMKYTDIVFNGNKYRAVTFSQYRQYCTGYTSSKSSTSYTYQDDNGYTTGNVYYFKYEPLTWRVLDPSEGFVVCSKAIDSQAYQNFVYYNGSESYNSIACTNYASDWATSSIREWLNDDFYNTAFSDSEKSQIDTSYNENKSTNSSTYDSANTSDKIFLLSHNEVINSKYGFNSSYTARRLKSTDYAQCQGCHKDTSTSYYGCSAWRLRSPSYFDDTASVDFDGSALYGHEYVAGTYSGIVPAMRIKLGFSARTAWSFPNTGSAFTADDGNTGKYYIHEEVYKEVFGQSFVDNVTLSDEWYGNCFGMSVSAIMFYLGKLDWNTCCGNEAISINEYVDGFNEDFGYTTVKRSSECVKYIERYQILDSLYEHEITISGDMNNGAYLNAPETNTLDEILKNDSYKRKYASYSDEFNTYLKDFYLHNFNQYPEVEVKTHNPNGDYIKNLLETIKNSDKPIGIGINGTSDHMMIIRTDKKCEAIENGWTRVYVYDPNHPYMPEEYSDRVINPNYCNGKEDNYYIELNPSENKWRYCGGERTDDTAKYCGCDIDGNVKYQFDYTVGLCTLQPDRICLMDLSILPTEFDGTVQWMENEYFIKSIIKDKGAVVKGYNDNELVVSLQDNHLVCKDEVKKANCYCGNEEAAESGSFIIPNDDYTFTISGGNIDFISNDCVFSVQSDNEVEFSIDNQTNTLIITAKEDSAIETKVSFIESNAKYQSGIVTGQISKGETVEISIDSKEISAESSKNDSLLNFSYKTESTEKTFVDEVKDNPRIDIAVIKNSKVNSVIIDDIEVKYKNTVKLTPTIDCDEEIEYTTTYTSSNPDVVTVDKDGNITTHKKGSATITCTVTDEYGNVVKDTCNVNVTFSFGQWLIWILLLGFLWY